jgi:hypothetical protein
VLPVDATGTSDPAKSRRSFPTTTFLANGDAPQLKRFVCTSFFVNTASLACVQNASVRVFPPTSEERLTKYLNSLGANERFACCLVAAKFSLNSQ